MTKPVPRFSSRAAWLWPAAVLGLLGCPNEELAPITPCTVAGVNDEITKNNVDEVDVLFVVDDSPSMKEEQENLARNLPMLVEILASGEIKDPVSGRVIETFPPVKSLHLGVTTTNLGVYGAPITTELASCAEVGDDGLLLNVPDKSIAGCNREFPKYLAFPAGNQTAQQLGASFGCVSRTGAGGCGFEQQLEAGFKALAPSSNATFYNGSTGHGDARNAGFMRADSVIAVIHISDEEDSSMMPNKGIEVFDTTKGDPSRANVRQYEQAEWLQPISRYVTGLKDLRPENPDLVIFAGIVGVPKGAESLDFDSITRLDAMKFVPEVGDRGLFYAKPACLSANGKAYPARRFVEVAKGFGKNGVIRSICDDDFSGALTAIIKKIAKQLEGGCLKRKLIADPQTGLAPCGLVEYLKLGSTAADCKVEEGRRYLEERTDSAGKRRIVCQLNQLKVDKKLPGCEAGETTPTDCLDTNPNSPTADENPQITTAKVGWYYDDFTAELKMSKPGCNEQRIAFTASAAQQSGSRIAFDCLQPVFSVFQDPKGVDAVNKPCGDQPAVCTNASNAEYTLECNARRATCQIKCAADSQCPESWVCDITAGAMSGICLNPTCPPL